jgi:hypothetical protein
MEIKGGMPSKRGGNTPGPARDYNIKPLRDACASIRRNGRRKRQYWHRGGNHILFSTLGHAVARATK